MSTPGIALVTGENKGIGLEVVGPNWPLAAGTSSSRPPETRGGYESRGRATAGRRQGGLPRTRCQRRYIIRTAQRVGRPGGPPRCPGNNAGILEKSDESVLDVGADVVLRTFTTNTLGPLLVTQMFLPLLLKSRQPWWECLQRWRLLDEMSHWLGVQHLEDRTERRDEGSLLRP